MEFPTILVFYHFLGAVITSTRVSKKLGAYFSTFGGNPVSCAIGLAVLDVINNENLMSSVRNVGKILQDQLSELRVCKVEFFWKSRFDPITFSEDSNYGWESLLEVQRQNIARSFQQTFEKKKFVDITQQCFAYYLE